MRNVKKQVKKAFTLIEILIVVVILGILAAIVVPQFTSATQDSQAGNLKAQLGTLQRQIELFRAKTNAWPWTAAGAANWDALINGNYVKEAPKNPAWNGTAGADDDLAVVNAASTRGSDTAGWVFNIAATGGTTIQNTIYASNFNETTGAVSTTRTD